jgi:hypothetical protein
MVRRLRNLPQLPAFTAELLGHVARELGIPADALGNATDAVTVTATSQGDNQVKDSAVLTTKCLDLNQKLYLPLILRNP